MIKVQNLSKSYENKKALDGVSFTVNTGEVMGVAGLAGAGKTSLMDILAGVSAADQGSVEIDGIAMDGETAGARALVGYVPAEPPVYRDMTPRALLKFQADARGISPREAVEKIDAAFKRLDLQDVADKPTRRLSRGAKQLISVAQASFFEPAALLVDEPTQGLDAREIVALRAAIRDMAKGRSVLLASANLTELAALCDRVIVLSAGKIVSEGTPDDLQNMTCLADTARLVLRADEQAVRAALSAVKGAEIKEIRPCADGVEAIVGMSGDQREALFLAAAAAKLPLLELTPARKPLQELLEGLVSERVEGGVEEA